MNNYKELKVWQKSVELAIRVYEVTKGFPHEEMYGLISQMRRSAMLTIKHWNIFKMTLM